MKGTPRRNGGDFEYVQLPIENPPLPPPAQSPAWEVGAEVWRLGKEIANLATTPHVLRQTRGSLPRPSPEQRERSKKLADELGLDEHNLGWFVECLIKADEPEDAEPEDATPTPYQCLKAKIMAVEAEKTKE